MLIKKITEWLLPYSCILCGNLSSRQQDLCQPCYQDLPIAPYPIKECSIALPDTYSLFIYQPPITRLILELKFNQALVHARVLGELLAEKIKAVWYRNKSLPEIIIPVPLHTGRLKERGFNQALEIARPVSKILHIPIDTHSCVRNKVTRAQATLSANARVKNIRHAFTVRQPLAYQHIAVIDDLITTGNTINEFCKTIKQHGGQQIDVWCAARPKML